jgi:hypothetical protein
MIELLGGDIGPRTAGSPAAARAAEAIADQHGGNQVPPWTPSSKLDTLPVL